MTKNTNRYDFGWSDYGAQHGRPSVEWKPIEPDPLYNFKMGLAYVGLAVGVSMAVAPMAWVYLFMWMLS